MFNRGNFWECVNCESGTEEGEEVGIGAVKIHISFRELRRGGDDEAKEKEIEAIFKIE